MASSNKPRSPSELLADRAMKAVLERRAKSIAAEAPETPKPPAPGNPENLIVVAAAPHPPLPAKQALPTITPPPIEPTAAAAAVMPPLEAAAVATADEPLAPSSQLGSHQLVRLNSWPAMRTFPPEQLPVAARLCALLARRPMVTYLLPPRLNMPKDIVLPVLNKLWAQGHIRIDGSSTAPTSSSEGHVSTSQFPPSESSRWSTQFPVVDEGTSSTLTGATTQAASIEPAVAARPSIWTKFMRKLMT